MENEQQMILKALKQVTHKNGFVYTELGSHTGVMCKPKILPLKSLTLQKLEEMEKDMVMMAKQSKQF